MRKTRGGRTCAQCGGRVVCRRCSRHPAYMQDARRRTSPTQRARCCAQPRASRSRLDCFRLIKHCERGTRPQCTTYCELRLMYGVRWCERSVFSRRIAFCVQKAAPSPETALHARVCTYTAPGVDKPSRGESRAGRIRSPSLGRAGQRGEQLSIHGAGSRWRTDPSRIRRVESQR